MDKVLQESVEAAEKMKQQAPNRKGIWSRSQQPRAIAMQGPRFEQTIMEDQPRPYAAIELIHKQPVRWTKDRMVACDGGGGPLGHPKIFINCDKPQINECTYCGLPFVSSQETACAALHADKDRLWRNTESTSSPCPLLLTPSSRPAIFMKLMSRRGSQMSRLDSGRWIQNTEQLYILRLLSDNQTCHAHTSANTFTQHTQLLILPLHLMQQGCQHASRC